VRVVLCAKAMSRGVPPLSTNHPKRKEPTRKSTEAEILNQHTPQKGKGQKAHNKFFLLALQVKSS
jgi:hypothetical protein